jgi:lysophospholipase L1-like esterase
MAEFHETETPNAAADWQVDGLPEGVRLSGIALLGALLVCGIPYGFPELERFRVWTPEDPIPFADKFRTDGVGPVVAEAGGHLGGNRGLDKAELAALSSTAGGEDEREADSPAPVLVLEPAPAPGNLGEVPDGAEAAPPRPRVVLPAAIYEGVKVSIEDPNGAMETFYAALERTALKEEGAVTRVAHWGDSAIGADGMTAATRRHLQRQFGDSGHGYMLIESGSTWYRHKDINARSKGWKAQKIIDKGAKDGRYGFGGVRARGYLGANATFGTVDEGPVGRTVSRFEVHMQKGPKTGNFSVAVDGGERQLVETASDTVQEAVHVLEVPDGPHEFRVRSEGGGPVYLYGAVMERSEPGVVYDCLGLVGARTQRLLNADPDHWKQQVATRKPDLMVLMYGGNDVGDVRIPMARYEKVFRQLVQRFRTTSPETSCLVMSPLDHGERYRGGVRTVPRQHPLMEVQRRIALEEGCAWYSVFEAMGGEGAMGRWFKASPRLGWGDFAHATPAGARVLGTYFFKALMEGLAGHLGQGIDPEPTEAEPAAVVP